MQPAETNPVVKKGWQKPFFLIWGGQAFSLLGSSLVQFALIWWMTRTTGSATVLAMATLAGFLPEVLLAPFAGALVDRWNRRRVMMIADGGIALGTVALALLFWSGAIQLWHVYLILFLRSIGSVFHWTSMQSSTSLMVPKQHLARVAGFNQSLQGGLYIMGPPLGALLLGLLPIHQVLLVDVITASLAILPLVFTAVPQPERSSAPTRTTVTQVLKDVSEGVRYALAWRALLAIMLIAALINFLMAPAFTLLPLLITNHFSGDVWHLGAIQSVWGVGIVFGGLVLGAWGGTRRRIYTSMMGLIGMGLGVLMVGISPPAAFMLAMAGMFLSGFMNPMTNGPLFAIVQARVEPQMQGRVFTLLTSVASAMVPLAMLVAGPISDLVGVRIWYFVAGAGCTLIGVATLLLPTVMKIEVEEKQAQPQIKPEIGCGSEASS